MMSAFVDNVAQQAATERPGPATFLLDGEGSMSVRVKPGLALGEDGDHRLLMCEGSLHRLLMAGISPQDVVLEFYTDLHRGLCMRAAGSHVLLNGTIEVPELVVIPATMLHLPHNSLYLSATQTRGEIRHHVRVRLKESAIASPQTQGRPLPTVRPSSDARVGSPVTALKASPLKAPRRPVAGVSPSGLKVMNSYISAFIGFAVVVALVGGMLVRDTREVLSDDATANALNSVPPSPAVPVQSPESPVQPAAKKPSDSTGTVERSADDSKPVEPVPVVVSFAASSDSLSIEARLAQADTRLQQGMVIWPQRDSAVDWIEGVLALEPQNPDALDMLDAAAKMLLTIASDAYEQGFRYDARNLLEEVLRFNPQYKDAQSLWQTWVLAPDADVRDASRIRGRESAS